MGKPERDPLTGQWTTGHSWDGIRELKTPVPIWWVSVFLISVAFALGYILFQPSFPSSGGAVFALNPVSTREALTLRQQEAAASLEEMNRRLVATPLDAIPQDAELARFAFNAGRALYQVHCIGCHGPGAVGQAGQFPALVNDDWIWGGTKEDIHTTIRYGIRNDDPESRQSQMPAFAEILTAAELDQVTDYVLLMGQAPPGSARRLAHPGHELFQQQCASCHGEDGRGNIDFGAPNLTDSIWLYGGTRAEIRQQIAWPRMGVMPGWRNRLTDAEIAALTVYVHGLGGGQPPRPATDATADVADPAAADAG
ncbi:MAG: cytochrome-c oxidase, cbb3-type subunit III [Sphingomonadaceae bacterium]